MMKSESDERSERMEQLVSRRKGNFGKFATPKKKRKNMAKLNMLWFSKSWAL